MAQAQSNCKKCRRTISKNTPQCPFCGAPNLNYENPISKTTPETTNTKPTENHQPKATEISIEEMAAMYREPVTVKESSNMETIDTAPISPTQEEETQNIQHTEAESTSPVQDTSTISTTQEAHRSKIPWEDEQPEDQPCTYTDMFNTQGQYQANYDGYYNDTIPKIQNEIDRALIGKEKILLKIIFTILGIAAIIVYLVLTS